MMDMLNHSDMLEKLLQSIDDERILLQRKSSFSKQSLEGLYFFAYHFYINGKYKEAVTIFHLLTNSDPCNHKFCMGYAASLQLSGQYEKALDVYSMAIVVDSRNPYPHFYAAECYVALGNYKEALKACLTAKRYISNKKGYQSLEQKIQLMQDAWANKGVN